MAAAAAARRRSTGRRRSRLGEERRANFLHRRPRSCTRCCVSPTLLPPVLPLVICTMPRRESRKRERKAVDDGGRFLHSGTRAKSRRESRGRRERASFFLLQFCSPFFSQFSLSILFLSFHPTSLQQGQAHAVQPHVAHQDRGRRVQGRDRVLPRQGENREEESINRASESDRVDRAAASTSKPQPKTGKKNSPLLSSFP